MIIFITIIAALNIYALYLWYQKRFGKPSPPEEQPKKMSYSEEKELQDKLDQWNEWSEDHERAGC